MNYGQTVLVACTIEPGAFSGERIVTFPIVEGPAQEYSGIAPVHYCLDEQTQPLGRDQPTKGNFIKGYVEAFLIANGGDRAYVELPDGQAVRVVVSRVKIVQKPKHQEPEYVPLGS
jgi:hypothetical protein